MSRIDLLVPRELIRAMPRSGFSEQKLHTRFPQIVDNRKEPMETNARDLAIREVANGLNAIAQSIMVLASAVKEMKNDSQKEEAKKEKYEYFGPFRHKIQGGEL